MKDMIIIGAGPAGLTAALYALRAGKDVLVFDKAVYGGQTVNTPEIENYPGIKTISGTDFAMRLYEQVEQLGVQYEYGDVLPVVLSGAEKKTQRRRQGIQRPYSRDCKRSGAQEAWL